MEILTCDKFPSINNKRKMFNKIRNNLEDSMDEKDEVNNIKDTKDHLININKH
jgi:hypothetical protein